MVEKNEASSKWVVSTNKIQRFSAKLHVDDDLFVFQDVGVFNYVDTSF